MRELVLKVMSFQLRVDSCGYIVELANASEGMNEILGNVFSNNTVFCVGCVPDAS